MWMSPTFLKSVKSFSPKDCLAPKMTPFKSELFGSGMAAFMFSMNLFLSK
jgi:hypothetical protein